MVSTKSLSSLPLLIPFFALLLFGAMPTTSVADGSTPGQHKEAINGDQRLGSEQTLGGDQFMVSLPALKDNTLYERSDGELSNGAGMYLFAGHNLLGSGFNKRRGLIAFDVGTFVPAGATVIAVELDLEMSRSNSGAQGVALHRLDADWGEGTSEAENEEGNGGFRSVDDVTWLHTFFDTSTWTTNGGDFQASPSASTSVNSEGSYTWGSSASMVADVQDWLDTPASNFGWLILGNEAGGGTAKRFNSREHDNTATRPVLRITYGFAGLVFSDGFEDGTADAWSDEVP